MSKLGGVPSKLVLWTGRPHPIALVYEYSNECTANTYPVIRFILTSCGYNVLHDWFATQSVWEYVSISKMASEIVHSAQAG